MQEILRKFSELKKTDIKLGGEGDGDEYGQNIDMYETVINLISKKTSSKIVLCSFIFIYITTGSVCFQILGKLRTYYCFVC